MAEREALETQADLANHLSGFACTQVSLGASESLIIDFGELLPDEAGDPSGEIVLAIGCPWRIDSPDLPAVGWDDGEDEIASQSTLLIDGQVQGVEVRRPGYDLNVQFSNGYRLRVFPDCRAYYSDDLSGGALPWQLATRPVVEPTSE